MKPREVGGAVSRANAVFAWVPYADGIVYEDDEEEEVEEILPPDGLIVGEVLDTEDDPGDPDEEGEEGEEVGYWMAITKVQARELIAEACTEDLEIEATETSTGLYIGLGPVP